MISHKKAYINLRKYLYMETLNEKMKEMVRVIYKLAFPCNKKGAWLRAYICSFWEHNMLGMLVTY